VSAPLSVFNNVSVDGYFTGPGGDLSWAHASVPDPEFDAFVGQNASGGGRLLLGRKTYDMMAAWWPTEAARGAAPEVADGMNRMTKIVFSRTMDRAEWSHTRVMNTDIAAAVQGLKEDGGEGMTILGSGTIVAQLAQAGLIDEYQVVVNPVVLGRGRTMFDGIERPPPLALLEARSFPGGKVVLRYAPRST
jgi:dihydrofolate reductase